jgi:putative hydrolase of the HAD superfamily
MILSNTVEGVLFDIDDTLVDTRGAFAHAMNFIAGKYLPGVGMAEQPKVLELWRADPSGHYRAYTRGEMTAREQRMARANQLHETFGGRNLSDDDFEVWDAEFMAAFRAGWKPFDESRAVIDTLRSRGYRVGALTNAGLALQTEKMRVCGLSDVDVLVTLDTFGVGKPDPRVFQEATRLLGTEPGVTAYVGDEPDIDALGALGAGLGAGIWVDRPGARRGGAHTEDPAAVARAGISTITSLTELL